MLLIDAGNSAIKWAQMAPDGTLANAQWKLHRGVADIESAMIEAWRGDAELGTPVIACSVAGDQVAAAIEGAARALEFAPVQWMQTQQRYQGQITLVNGYRNAGQLGADRWHGMLGACTLPGTASSLIVANAGTATTVDCIEAASTRSQSNFAGTFVGGIIVPGVRLMLESLARSTAGLPAAAARFPHAAADFPLDTDAAIVTGVLDAQCGAIVQVSRRFAARSGTEPRLILTGGHAEALQSRLSIAAQIEHNLVVRGLALRARSQSPKS